MTQAAQTTPAAPAALNENSKKWVEWLIVGGVNAFASIINKEDDKNCKNALNQIPRFDHEDHPELTCIYMGFEASRFEEGQIQLCLYLYDRNNQRGGWWTGPMSQQYCRGNDADKTYFQKTIAQLEKVGVTISNKNAVDWWDVLRQIFGKTFPCWVAEKETKDGSRKYYIVQSLGASDFAAPAPIAWPTMQMAAPAAPMAPAAPSMPQMPTAPAPAPAVPQVTVADIPKANPFAR